MARRMLFTLLVVLSVTSSQNAFAKPSYRKELGRKSCTDCHNREDLKSPSTKPYYLKAMEMRQKLRGQEGKFKGKTTCYDCHEGEPIGST